jgi:hypothetical protein
MKGWGVGVEFEKAVYRGMEKNQLPHWNNRCRMECCQKLHPQLVVFKEQRSSPLCEMLAVEICESAYPSPAKNNFNAEAPSLKRKKSLSTCPNEMNPKPTRHETQILPNSRARIWNNSACRNVCLAVRK